MFKKLILAAMLAFSAISPQLAFGQSKLEFTVYNPGEKSMFPVTSTLIEGPTELVLVDAQFQRNDAEQLRELIQKTGKKLKLVYVSHADPDYYFGLDVIKAAFPDAKIVTTQPTLDKIAETIEGKIAFWGPILKENAPKQTVLPEVISSDQFTVDNVKIHIHGLDGHDPAHTSLWVPSERTILGGVLVYDNAHVWQADNPTPEKRASWIKSLESLEELNPKRVIPGHFVGGTNSQTVASIKFTRTYVEAVNDLASNVGNSQELVQALQNYFPGLGERGLSDIKLSAKVIMGEMKWPAE